VNEVLGCSLRPGLTGIASPSHFPLTGNQHLVLSYSFQSGGRDRARGGGVGGGQEQFEAGSKPVRETNLGVYLVAFALYLRVDVGASQLVCGCEGQQFGQHLNLRQGSSPAVGRSDLGLS
jgi:hypothetical protein